MCSVLILNLYFQLIYTGIIERCEDITYDFKNVCERANPRLLRRGVQPSRQSLKKFALPGIRSVRAVGA